MHGELHLTLYHKEDFVMCKRLGFACLIGLVLLLASFPVNAQISTGPGGVNFDEAAKLNPVSKDFHTNDGVLTIGYVTHTAGNGFFNPCYVGATTAAQAFTAMGVPGHMTGTASLD